MIPKQFEVLDSLLRRMPVLKKDGSSGLLKEGNFGAAVLKELPLYDVDSITDSRLISGIESCLKQ